MHIPCSNLAPVEGIITGKKFEAAKNDMKMWLNEETTDLYNSVTY